MRYDISAKQKLTERYADLKHYPQLEWSGGLNSDTALRYCIALIDEESPIYKITDLSLRQERALELAGVKKTGRGYSSEIKAMIDGHDEKVNEMLFILMGIYHNPLFELWYSSKVSMHYLLKTLRTPPKELNSKQMADEARVRAEIETKLNSMMAEQLSRESKIFRDEALKVKLAGVAMQKIIPYPEQFAEEQ